MLKNLKRKITLALSVMMVSSIPVFANATPDTFSILLDGRPLNVAMDLAIFENEDMTIEEILSIALGGNVVIVENLKDEPQEVVASQNVADSAIIESSTVESSTATSTEPTTKSKITLPNRKLTDDELNAWIEDYEEQGGANEFELEVVRLVNIERAKENLPALIINELAMKGARFKSQEMLDLDYFAHESPVYGNSYIEVDLFGYEDGAYGENIGKGGIPEQMVEGWMNSPGHRRAIMDKEHKTVGVGFVKSLWTINFGM